MDGSAGAGAAASAAAAPAGDQSLLARVAALEAELAAAKRVAAGQPATEPIALEEHDRGVRIEMAVRHIAGVCGCVTEVDRLLGEDEPARERPIASS